MLPPWKFLKPRHRRADARPVTGHLFSRGPGDRLGLGGAGRHAGRLFVASGDKVAVAGTAEVALRTWNHVALVRNGAAVTVYLNGKSEVAGDLPAPPRGPELSFGGEADAGWEGRLDEIAVYDRALGVA